MFTIDNIFTLITLIFLQGVLGVDNLLYIAIESRKVEPSSRSKVRRLGIFIAVAFRILLLLFLVNLIHQFQQPIFGLDTHFLHGEFTLQSLIVLLGGVFILFTSTKEILHLVNYNPQEINESDNIKYKQKNNAIASIVFVNVIFSFDSILAAMALTDVLVIMIIAIVLGGLLMIVLADRVADFLSKNRMFEVLGLFILFIVGIMLLSDGAHLSHLKIFDNEIMPMSKSTFYFVIGVLIIIDIVQHRYNKLLGKT